MLIGHKNQGDSDQPAGAGMVAALDGHLRRGAAGLNVNHPLFGGGRVRFCVGEGRVDRIGGVRRGRHHPHQTARVRICPVPGKKDGHASGARAAG